MGEQPQGSDFGAVFLLLRFLLILGLICFSLGCKPLPPKEVIVSLTLPGPPPIKLHKTNIGKQADVFSFCRTLDYAAGPSYEEACSRFVNPVVVMGHGGYTFGYWTLFADGDRGGAISVDALGKYLSKTYPDRDIVLFICNKQGSQIKANRVWYFRSVVWSLPDEYFYRHGVSLIPYDRELLRNFGNAGSIWESVMTP